ncbi:polyamine aminopropyltransferase [Marinitoga litoralis]|uniref:polyamine aminopropyltransferase n=1 Tax=Marinitoga litoralis TaxID=570855 RepID=UPI001960B0E1|nr:polyamine aminopropyltransferase [Marinitoga litoralis]MBM7559377.1 spermidine synthase [Marinitoga litoralis]
MDNKLEAGRHLLYMEWYTGGDVGLFMKMNRVLFSGQSEFQRVDVFENPELGRVFSLDGITMTTEVDEFMYHEMLTHVPMFIHPNPKRVLVIGGGDGGTTREVLKHPSVEEVILCEIDPLVIEAARKYLPTTSVEFDNPKLKIVNENGAEYIKQFENYFDVIIIDSTDPTAGEGGHLFTEDFYKSCYNALTENGVFSAETEDPFYDRAWVGIAYNRIKNVFPVAKVYLGFMTTYPSGMWSYTFASKGLDPLKDFDPEKIRNFEKKNTLKYYNEEIHVASFALPNFVKKLIGLEK